jgi:K+-sensing histidine kinase KdpD
MRILPKQIQLLAVIAVLCVAGSNVVVNDSAKASGKAKRYGMGTGPAIVRSTIASHDSELAATNVEGRGACVHFSLPAFAKGKAE